MDSADTWCNGWIVKNCDHRKLIVRHHCYILTSMYTYFSGRRVSWHALTIDSSKRNVDHSAGKPAEIKYLIGVQTFLKYNVVWIKMKVKWLFLQATLLNIIFRGTEKVPKVNLISLPNMIYLEEEIRSLVGFNFENERCGIWWTLPCPGWSCGIEIKHPSLMSPCWWLILHEDGRWEGCLWSQWV